MASKRQLKGDIRYIVKELVSECMAYTLIVPDADYKSAEDIINGIVEYYGTALVEINAVRKNDKKDRGDNLKAIRHEMTQKVPEFIDRLSKLSQNK